MRYQFYLIDAFQIIMSIALGASLLLPWNNDQSNLEMILYPSQAFHLPASLWHVNTYLWIFPLAAIILMARNSYNYASVTTRTLTRTTYGIMGILVGLLIWVGFALSLPNMEIGYWLSSLSLALLALLLGIERWIIFYALENPVAIENQNLDCVACGLLVPRHQRRCPHCGTWQPLNERQ